MKILVFYVDKQYFNMVILFLRLRVRRELIIRRDGRAVEGTGLENRRCESIRGFESHSLRQFSSRRHSKVNPFEAQCNYIGSSFGMEKYPRGRRGSPAKGVVRDERSEGSNPSFSANNKPCNRNGYRVCCMLFLCYLPLSGLMLLC